MDIAKTLAEGGKEVVAALDKRISDVTARHQYARRQARRDASAPRSTTSTRRSAPARIEVADNLDSRIGRFEELLVGRAEAVTKEIETRSKAAADLLSARTRGADQRRSQHQYRWSVEQSLNQLTANDASEMLGKSTSEQA